MLAFQCKSFSSKTKDRRKGLEVSFYSLSFNRDSQNFSVRDGTRLWFTRTALQKPTSFIVAPLDVQQRQKVPCVLLRLCKKRTSAFKYVLYSICTSTDAKLHAEFVLPYEMRDNISILLGPTLIWSHENSFFYTSSQTNGVREVPIPMTVNFIGELPLRRRKLVIQGAQNVPSDQSKVKNILYFTDDGSTLDSACLVPDAYGSVMQCMMVHSAEEVDGGLRSAVLAATRMKQLVCFENGLPGRLSSSLRASSEYSDDSQAEERRSRCRNLQSGKRLRGVERHFPGECWRFKGIVFAERFGEMCLSNGSEWVPSEWESDKTSQ